MINFEHITKIYPNHSEENNTIALNEVSFEIKEKEFISIVGKSGAGKTTLLKLLLVEEAPTHGAIFFDGEDISKIRTSHLCQFRRRIGSIFQDYKLISSKNVYENIAYVMEIMGIEDEQIKYDVSHVLEIVGLAHRASNFPAELSGGEKQRLAIARALIHRPQIIIADEPTGNLDPYHTKDITNLLLRINELGTTIILATHHKEIVNSIKKRVITLEEGRLVRDEEQGRFIL
ncbi:ATP-binding cassette domain-containing protein [Candidatus Parcubacteria bacterium]|nr:ATP-binding cassette domain-containing protein [Candidatus Parcubacteria bacterium]